MERGESIKIEQIMEAYVRSEGLQKGLESVRVSEAWDKAVGPQIAAASSRKSFRDGEFFVTITSSVLRNSLLFRIQSVIDAMNATLGSPTVRYIHLR